MSFPRYPTYKDSGVEWLGAVPGHWTSVRYKNVFDEKRSITGTDLPPGSISFGRVIFKDDEFLHEPTKASYQEVLSGEFLINPINLNYDLKSLRTALSEIDTCVSPAYIVLKAKVAADKNYLKYQLHVFDLFHMKTLGAGVRQTITFGDIGDCFTCIPSFPEQIQIAAFLDSETAKIDALVAEQRRLMELLKEKRQAVISHAVTRGLNPDAPLKPSGIEWLGDVPAHWEVHRVKDYFQTCSGGTPNTTQQELYYSDAESGIPWVRTTDLRNDVLQAVEIFITEKALADTACTVLPSGTVMVAMYGGDGTVGKNGLLAIPAAINQAVCGLLPTTTHSPEFAFRFMQFYRPHWMIGAESSRKDPNISQERVRNAPFLRPPRHEQDAIVSFLDSQLQQFDTLTTEAQRAIDLLQERRTALISAAVTGQIDVRGLTPADAEKAAA